MLSSFYVVLCAIAFFGTGNIVSISSFEISSTYRLVTIFSPFIMALLLLFKIFLPFVLACVCLIQVIRKQELSILPAYIIITIIYDLMTMNFLFLVREEGSWKEIGLSISQFILSSLFGIIQLILFLWSLLYLRQTTGENDRDEKSFYKSHVDRFVITGREVQWTKTE